MIQEQSVFQRSTTLGLAPWCLVVFQRSHPGSVHVSEESSSYDAVKHMKAQSMWEICPFSTHLRQDLLNRFCDLKDSQWETPGVWEKP